MFLSSKEGCRGSSKSTLVKMSNCWISHAAAHMLIGYLQYYRLEHWDVNNENLHGDFYERQTGDANITMKMFRDMYALDQTTKLFLNDYNVIKYSGNQLATVC